MAVAELHGMPSLPPDDLDQRVDRIRTTSDKNWSVTRQRGSIIRELLKSEGSMAERLAAAATMLDVSQQTVGHVRIARLQTLSTLEIQRMT